MKNIEHDFDFVVVGAGLAGICAAVTAARSGLKTALINDRPVLGGNASKEIRVPPVGARCCNSAYTRETGLIEELMLENLRTNPTCSPEGWNLVMLNCVKAEPNLHLFLNTVVNEVLMTADGSGLASVRGYTINSETFRRFRARQFADCSGDGTLAVLAKAPFRHGIEGRSEFNESLCAEEAQTFTMGSSIWFMTRDAGRAAPFERPPWIGRVIEADDFGRHRAVLAEYEKQRGGFWWLELGGDHDMVHDSAVIADNLLALVYGVWDYLKNRSPLRDSLISWELEWVGSLPAKRESRRFEGDHILTQGDIEQQRHFPDAIAFGGWGFDHHPREGFFDRVGPSFHTYHPGAYNVPLRSLYSRTVRNLFLAGRNISATHYALSSTRIMLTCAQLGEAVGLAASFCVRRGEFPRQLANSPEIARVQQQLLRIDHHLHGIAYNDSTELGRNAVVTASSALDGDGVQHSDGVVPLHIDRLWQLPLASDQLDAMEIRIDAASATSLNYVVWIGPDSGSNRPERKLLSGELRVEKGRDQWVRLRAALNLPRPGWYFLELAANPAISVHFSRLAPVGFLGYDVRPEDPIRPNPYSRWKSFKSSSAADVWTVEDGTLKTTNEDPWDGMAAESYCVRITPTQPIFDPANVISAWNRPALLPNLWISKPTDFAKPEWVQLDWSTPIQAGAIEILFDSALDIHITSLWIRYQRTSIPALVREYRLLVREAETGEWIDLGVTRDNHRRRCVHSCSPMVITAVRLEIISTHGLPRAQVYSMRVYPADPRGTG